MLLIWYHKIVVLIWCLGGYTLGNPQTCTAGSWTSTNSCTLSASTCATAFTATGYTSTGAGTSSGAAITLSCITGYTKNSNPSVMCNNGVWGSVTGGSCDMNCALPPTITNSLTVCTGSTNSGSTCAFTCQTGYTATGSKLCTSGTFSTAGTCVASPCSTPPTISNSASNCGGI